MTDTAPSPELLRELAELYSVATEFWTFTGELKQISPATLTAVLGAMNVDASSESSCRAAIEQARTRAWRLTLPECTVVREGGTPNVPVHLRDGSGATMDVLLEDGSTRSLAQVEVYVLPQTIDGVLIGEASFLSATTPFA